MFSLRNCLDRVDPVEGAYNGIIIHRKADGFMAIHPVTGLSRFLTFWESVKFRLGYRHHLGSIFNEAGTTYGRS